MRRRGQRVSAHDCVRHAMGSLILISVASCSDMTGPVNTLPEHSDRRTQIAARPWSAGGDLTPEVENAPTLPMNQPLFSDDFRGPSASCTHDGGSVGNWLVVYTGYGCISRESGDDGAWLRLRPQQVSDPAATSAALVIASLELASSNRIDLRLRMITDVQLRQGSTPNPWEVAWVIWQYTDPDHFYYFIAKPNGWELGKRDPAYAGGQRFLATGSEPQYPIGTWYDVRITQRYSSIEVAVDGRRVVRFEDKERPYLSGKFGAYNEDAATRITDVVVLR